MSTADWTTPGVDEVAPGVYRIPLPLPNDGLRAVNVYAVTGPDGPVLVDAGWSVPEAMTRLRDALTELGIEIGDIARFLVTHVHRDHYSQAIRIRQEFGTRVSLGAEERWALDAIMRPGRHPVEEQIRMLRELAADDLADQLEAHLGAVDRMDWELPDDWFTNGEVISVNGRGLEVVETPGHTRGHVVFHDLAGGLLFAGDHVLPTITPSIGFEPVVASNPLGSFLASLALVRSRPDAMLLPAHGPVTGSVHARVDELVEHHRARLDAMTAVLGWGVDTAAGVAVEVSWTRRGRRFDALDLFNRFLAVCETGAHLDLLVAQGRVALQVRDGVRHYALV
ncbi:MAG TPA: MBL fold metallo-hydrolase [Mycobacteriales bacterium]|nr:MBL fold metallo-hydrolase [Mycobacteriales bacterium]